MGTELTTLFTYGTLMYPEVLEALLLRTLSGTPAVLRDYERRRIEGKPYPGIFPCAGASVPGVMYSELDRLTLELLDRFEGMLYSRVEVVLETGSGSAPALAYV